MALSDFERRVSIINSVRPVLAAATKTGTSADLSGYGGATIYFSVGVLTDGTHTPKIQESSDNSAFTDVAAADLQGTALVALVSATDQKIGYTGSKQYIRPVVTITGSPGTGCVFGVSIIRHAARKQP